MPRVRRQVCAGLAVFVLLAVATNFSTGAQVWRTELQGTAAVDGHGRQSGMNVLVSHLLYLPLIMVPPEATPTPTLTPTPTATPISVTVIVLTPTPTATPTATTPPLLMPGANLHCSQSGAAEICAQVSNASPAQNSSVTVYGRLLVDGAPQVSRPMTTRWHYKTTTSACDSGFTGGNGVAQCSRSIGRASIGYTVQIEVTIEGYKVNTSFTP